MTIVYFTNVVRVDANNCLCDMFANNPAVSFTIDEAGVDANHRLLRNSGQSKELDVVTLKCVLPDDFKIASIEQAEAIAAKFWDLEDEYVYSPDMFYIDGEFLDIDYDDVMSFINELKAEGYDGAIVPSYDGGCNDEMMLFNCERICVDSVFKIEPY